MRAVLIIPLSTNVAEAITHRVDPQDPQFVKARIKVDWWKGHLRIRHPNFVAVVTRTQKELALERAREEAVKMLPEYQIGEDYEVKLL